MQKTKIDWRTRPHNIPGNAYGYNAHNSAMMRFSEPYFDFCDDAEIALTITPADFFVPVPGKVNVLFTMWESLDLPNSYLQRLGRADALIVPCRFCRDLFRGHYDGPIYVCAEGVDPSKFNFIERKTPSEKGKFRFLWVGAPNPRKGYPYMLEIADKVFQHQPNVEIYLKTTAPKVERREFVTNLWKQRRALRGENPAIFKEMLTHTKNPDVSNKVMRTGKYNNIIWDSRNLPFDELVDLYRSADCFVLPTTGEGWGLTLTEAMATGLPCIATPVTGVADYFDEDVGYPVRFGEVVTEFKNYRILSRVYTPDVNSVLDRMVEVIKNYGAAMQKGKRASNKILTRFTWARSAQRLSEIIKEIEGARYASHANS